MVQHSARSGVDDESDREEAVTEEEAGLLVEWFRWWRDSDDAPAKMPEALHIRTAMLLQQMGYEVLDPS